MIALPSRKAAELLQPPLRRSAALPRSIPETWPLISPMTSLGFVLGLVDISILLSRGSRSLYFALPMVVAPRLATGDTSGQRIIFVTSLGFQLRSGARLSRLGV